MASATFDLIDAFLADVRHLSLIDGDRVRDFALDLRLLLAAPAETAIEGEPHEDAYFHGVPDYDRFGRPSWGDDE